MKTIVFPSLILDLATYIGVLVPEGCREAGRGCAAFSTRCPLRSSPACTEHLLYARLGAKSFTYLFSFNSPEKPGDYPPFTEDNAEDHKHQITCLSATSESKACAQDSCYPG